MSAGARRDDYEGDHDHSPGLADGQPTASGQAIRRVLTRPRGPGFSPHIWNPVNATRQQGALIIIIDKDHLIGHLSTFTSSMELGD
jgi:hypothetical protein